MMMPIHGRCMAQAGKLNLVEREAWSLRSLPEILKIPLPVLCAFRAEIAQFARFQNLLYHHFRL